MQVPLNMNFLLDGWNNNNLKWMISSIWQSQEKTHWKKTIPVSINIWIAAVKSMFTFSVEAKKNTMTCLCYPTSSHKLTIIKRNAHSWKQCSSDVGVILNIVHCLVNNGSTTAEVWFWSNLWTWKIKGSKMIFRLVFKQKHLDVHA